MAPPGCPDLEASTIAADNTRMLSAALLLISLLIIFVYFIVYIKCITLCVTQLIHKNSLFFLIAENCFSNLRVLHNNLVEHSSTTNQGVFVTFDTKKNRV
jgi:hypothetical protein